MKIVRINGPEDLTEENLTIFEEGLKEIERLFPSKKPILLEDEDSIMNFESLESCLKYFDAVPFDEFDKKFRETEDNN